MKIFLTTKFDANARKTVSNEINEVQFSKFDFSRSANNQKYIRTDCRVLDNYKNVLDGFYIVLLNRYVVRILKW